jgi:ABC-type dipeptide/oligopeptide/nickel transport system permease subunit
MDRSPARATPMVAPPPPAAARWDTPARQFAYRFRHSFSARAGAVVVLTFIALAAVGPLIAPYDPIATALPDRLQGPGPAHWLGTDALGRDVLSRLLAGSRLSLSFGMIVGLSAVVVGVPLGTIAGYLGGLIDDVIMRVMDVLLALPGLLLAIAIVATLGPGLGNALIAVAIVSVPAFARVARASTLRTRQLLYVEGARASGCGTLRILRAHVLPNIAAPLLVLLSLRIATGLLTASSLGFLGLGAQPPEPEWGAMLSDGRAYLRVAAHVTTVPGIAIMLAVLGFNLLGDGLRDALDPRMATRTVARHA